jgi:uncharacterized protein
MDNRRLNWHHQRVLSLAKKAYAAERDFYRTPIPQKREEWTKSRKASIAAMDALQSFRSTQNANASR